MRQQFKQRLRIDDRGQAQPGPNPVYTPGTCRVQVVRSVSDWSHGVLKESSIQNACSSFPPRTRIGALNIGVSLDCQLIQEANHYIYIGTLHVHDHPRNATRLSLVS